VGNNVGWLIHFRRAQREIGVEPDSHVGIVAGDIFYFSENNNGCSFADALIFLSQFRFR
jgi:hypothetical protein